MMSLRITLLWTFMLPLGLSSPVASGDEGVLKIPVSVRVEHVVPASEEDESLYRQIVRVFWSAQGPVEGGRHNSPVFSDFALAAPGLFFSNDHEATSQRIIASEFTRLMANGETERVWQQCLSLRWISAHIDLFAPVCKTAGQKVDGKTPGALVTGDVITIPAQPETTAALHDYWINPYDAERLRQLLRLIQTSRVEELAPLLHEMTQLDDQYLWNRSKGSKSLGDWTLYGIEKSLADSPP